MDWQGGAKVKQSQHRIGKAEKDKVKQWDCIAQRTAKAWGSYASHCDGMELRGGVEC